MKMKTIHNTIIGLLALTVLVFQSCKKDEPVNQNPTCTISSPTNGQEITKGETVTISVNATDSDGSIAKVEFFIDNISKGSVSNPPFNYNWDTSGESIGNHTIKATSIDNSGTSTSDEISVEIIEGGIAGTFTDPRDGKTYITVALGEQTWLSENLNFDTSGSMRVLNNNGNVYGRLYTWQSALTACPSGWHLPSDEEWKTLEMWLHMLQWQADGIGWRGNVQGWLLKGMTDWGNGGQGGSQRYIFNALPAGYINEDGELKSRGNDAFFWTATDYYSTEDAWYRHLNYASMKIRRSASGTELKFSVRCARD